MEDFDIGRRDLLLTSLFAAIPLGISQAAGSPLNPEQTIIRGPDKLEWKSSQNYPEKSARSLYAHGRHQCSGPLLHAYPLVARLYECTAFLYD